ncbi:hypothetical protein POM88_024576 [Heracleum sosnowskyi]|uniref:Uncharacterized protein n=1 Tax=Heracleum sosnowskyi TaxID=360622 RepID=A0AAD8I4C3_9APIA|nr:hypothetical protein POM88_024576 [Heracleum sosnowskyi]
MPDPKRATFPVAEYWARAIVLKKKGETNVTEEELTTEAKGKGKGKKKANGKGKVKVVEEDIEDELVEDDVLVEESVQLAFRHFPIFHFIVGVFYQEKGVRSLDGDKNNGNSNPLGAGGYVSR